MLRNLVRRSKPSSTHLRTDLSVFFSLSVFALVARALKNTMGALKPWAKVPATVGKWTGYAIKATKVCRLFPDLMLPLGRIMSLDVGCLTIALDVVLIIIAAVEGAEQRTRLQEATKELLPRRAMTKFWKLQAAEVWQSDLSKITGANRDEQQSSSANKLVIDYLQGLFASLDTKDDPMLTLVDS